MCRKCRRAASSLASPAKSILLVFKHQHLTRVGGRGVGLFCLAAPRSNVHPWQSLPTDSAATERAVRFWSHYAICFSSLLLFSTDICLRGFCGWQGRALSSRGRRGGGCLSPPVFPRDPKPNWNEILNDSQVSPPSKKFSSMGSSSKNHPGISLGENVPFVSVDNLSVWLGFVFLLILVTFKRI